MFTLDTFRFLDELALNNERPWFEANKDRYEALVREPARAFIRAMSGPLAEVSVHFLADDKKVGGSLMRVQRDTRFGHDKTPYKTNVGIQFRHLVGKDVHAPGFYVHVSPSECFLGYGTWRPEPPLLLAIREKIRDEHPRWQAVEADPRVAALGLVMDEGDPVKRMPKGFDADHPAAATLRRTSFLMMAPLTAKQVTSKRFVAHVAERFLAGRELMRFLCEAAGVTF